MLLDAWRLALGTLTAVPVAPPGVVFAASTELALATLPVGLS